MINIFVHGSNNALSSLANPEVGSASPGLFPFHCYIISVFSKNTCTLSFEVQLVVCTTLIDRLSISFAWLLVLVLAGEDADFVALVTADVL